MSLVVIGRESLDELEQMVKEKFSSIKNHNIAIPVAPDMPYGSKQCRKRITYLPVKDSKQVKVLWQLPSQHAYYKSNPLSYLSNLIGHESEGSILALLKQKNWGQSLSCGQGCDTLSFSTLEISIDLTDEGTEHIDEIITIVYQYIQMLRISTPQEGFFTELSQVAATKLRFRQKLSDVVSDISSL